MAKGRIQRHTDLKVYQRSFDAAMALFDASKVFPKSETYSLTDQIRRASRSVCANLGEAWRKRNYKKAFLNKLSDCTGEATEVQVWIQFAVECKYITRNRAAELYREYDAIIGMLVTMIAKPEEWTI
jgi:four helix bundle protein